MSIGLIGRKRGMTRVFADDGTSTPVTVVELLRNRVTQIKDVEADGYRAIQLAAGERRASRVTRPLAGHYKRAGIEAGNVAGEFRIPEDVDLPTRKQKIAAKPVDGEQAEPAAQDAGEQQFEDVAIQLGDELNATVFSDGQIVDVTGQSIGKGYAGAIKRHNFSSQRMTHGNAKSHRAPGSIGQNQTPGHVFKGKKMSGQLGNKQCTVQNLQIVRVDAERNLLLIKGGVPGSKGSDLLIRPAVKRPQPRGTQA